MALTRRLALAAVLALAATAGLTACGTGDGDAAAGGKIELRLPDPGNSGLLALGKKDGSLDAALGAAGATVAWTGTTGPFAPAAQAINANQLDVAQGSITSGIGSLAANPGFKLFATGKPDPVGEGILVKKDSPITGLEGLIGKKVAVNEGGTGEYLLLQALKSAHIAAEKVERVYLTPDKSASAFNSGQVDAWATWSTYSVAALAQGNARQLVQAGDVASDNYTIWAVRTAFATEHPAVVKALYDYLHAGSAALIADPAPYVNVFSTGGAQALDEQAKRITVEFWKRGSTIDTIGAQDEARYATVAQFFADAGVTKSKVDVAASVLELT